jgi:hypothetical protein
MLKVGIVVPSLSPFASLVLLVRKKDVSWRFCVDYTRLNTIIVKNNFSLHVIDELSHQIFKLKLNAHSTCA